MLASENGYGYDVDSDGDLELDTGFISEIGIASYIYLTEKDLLDMLSAVRSHQD